MRRFTSILYGLLVVLLLAAPAQAQRGGRSYVVGFYNLENLFDTYHDEGKNDYGGHRACRCAGL